MHKNSFLHQHSDFYELVRIVSSELDIDPFFVEKDYWIMHCLFGLQKAGFTFQLKGGTSLSKGHNLIKRFSEDVDIRIKPPSGLNPNSTNYLHSRKAIEVRKDYLDSLPIKLQIEGIHAHRDHAFDDKQNLFRHGGVRLLYKSGFTIDESVAKEGVLLEIGFDEIGSAIPISISSWVYDYAELNGVQAIDNRAQNVSCLEAGYTLAEKLQAIAKRYGFYKKYGRIRDNFLRHYYDVYCLLQDKTILNFTKTKGFVVHLKRESYTSNDNIPLSKNPAFLLSNPKEFEILRNKYLEEESLYYQGQPDFAEVMDVIRSWAKEFTLDLISR